MRLHLLTWIIAILLLPAAFPATVDPSAGGLTAIGATYGDALILQTKNRSRLESTWTAPPGIVAEPLDGKGPAMIVRRIRGRRIDSQRYEQMEAIKLKPGENAEFILEAYSLDVEKKEPEKGAPYRFTTQRQDLVKIFELADELKISGRVVQSALWLATSDLPREKLKAAIPIPPNEFDTAFELAARVKKFADIKAPVPIPLPRPAQARVGVQPLGAVTAPLAISSDKVKLGQTGEARSATIMLNYKWNVPNAARPRTYIIGVRFESPDLTSAVVPGRMIFDEEEGAYESVVQQGVLKGKGELVYAVLKDFTEATDQAILEQKFDALLKEAVPELMSNVLRVPVNWQDKAQSPLDAALSAISENPASQQSLNQFSTSQSTGVATPTPTPSAPLDKALAFAVPVKLPLPNGGVLEGELIGLRQGKLVLRGNMREIEFSAAYIGRDAEDILNQAKRALSQNNAPQAMQLATIAGLLMEDPTPAAQVYEQAK